MLAGIREQVAYEFCPRLCPVSAVLRHRSQEAFSIILCGISVLSLLLAVGVNLGEDFQTLTEAWKLGREGGSGVQFPGRL